MIATSFRLIGALVISTIALAINACGSEGTTVQSVSEFTGSPANYQTDFENCLRNKGFEVTTGDNKGREGSVVVPAGVTTREESKAFFDAMENCTNELPPRPVVDTDAEISAYYIQWIDRWDCLSKNGYDVGARLTEATFKDKFRSETLDATPHELLSFEQQDDAYLSCPIPQDTFWG